MYFSSCKYLLTLALVAYSSADLPGVSFPTIKPYDASNVQKNDTKKPKNSFWQLMDSISGKFLTGSAGTFSFTSAGNAHSVEYYFYITEAAVFKAFIPCVILHSAKYLMIDFG